jgi:hypothetical protein
MNDVTTHWMVSTSARRLVIILGRATFRVPKLRPWVRIPNIKARLTHHLWDGCLGHNHEVFFPLLSSDIA